MFDSNDIYRHLMNGGKPENLHKALDIEIEEANKKVVAAREAEKKEKELADKVNKARTAAFKALKSYYALVNPDVTEDVINFVLDTLGIVEFEVNEINGIRGKGDIAATQIFRSFI